jgi:hypothetical protein
VQHILYLTLRFWPINAFEFFFFMSFEVRSYLYDQDLELLQLKWVVLFFYSDASSMFFSIINKDINSLQHVAPLSATLFGSHGPWWDHFFKNNLKNIRTFEHAISILLVRSHYIRVFIKIINNNKIRIF